MARNSILWNFWMEDYNPQMINMFLLINCNSTSYSLTSLYPHDLVRSQLNLKVYNVNITKTDNSLEIKHHSIYQIEIQQYIRFRSYCALSIVKSNFVHSNKVVLTSRAVTRFFLKISYIRAANESDPLSRFSSIFYGHFSLIILH